MLKLAKRDKGHVPEGVVNPDGHVIGLDIGTTAVRAAVLVPAADGTQSMTVHEVGSALLAPGTIVGGMVADAGELTRTLSLLWKSHDFGCHNVIIGVSNTQVVVRAMHMPRLPREQQAKALPFQARDVIALPLDKVVLDFQELGPVDGDPDRVSGLLIAAPREPVLAAVRAVEAAGLRIVRVDLASFATLRSAAARGFAAEAVVDIGAEVTTILIHHRGIPKVVRTLARGGQQLTDRLVERTGAGVAEAEILKRELGLLDPDSEVSMILSSAVRPLVTDIRGSVQYFGTTNDSVSLDRVSLTGGGAELRGLVELLAEDLGVPCGVVSPLQHVLNGLEPPTTDEDSGYRDDVGAASAVSIGLAMGAAA